MAYLRIKKSEIASRAARLMEIYASSDGGKSMEMVMLGWQAAESRCPGCYSCPRLFEQTPTTWGQGQRNSQIFQSPRRRKPAD